MDGWNTTFLLGRPIFKCYVSFREGNFFFQHSNCQSVIVNKWFFRVPAGMSSKPPFDSSNPFQPSPTWRIIPFSKELGSPPSSAIWKGCITTRSRKGTYILTMVINHRLNQVMGWSGGSSSDPSLTAAWNGTCWKPFFFSVSGFGSSHPKRFARWTQGGRLGFGRKWYFW